MTILDTLITMASIGYTIGALTLPIKDNVYWKICEYMYVGFGAGYIFVVTLKALNANLFVKLAQGNILYIIPLILSLMLYSRYVKKVSWLNRYPVMLMIAVGTAISMRTIIYTMFLKQITSTLINPFAVNSAQLGTIKTPINNILIVVTVAASIFYFIFWEQKWMQNKAIGTFRKYGLTMIMMSFGVLIGYSLIMRVARLGARFFYILAPENLVYTAIFTLLGIASLYLARE